MKDRIRVSVIIPIYNVEKYIEECLTSVINQTLREIEIICVNDGTLDNSMDIVNHYVKADSRIVVVNKENGGLSSARNFGLDMAYGEYVYFLDSDDYIKPETLEKLYSLASNKNLDNILFSAESLFENDEVKNDNKQYLTYYNRSKEYSDVYSGQELFAKLEENNDFKPSACLQLNRKSMIEEYNIRFCEGILHEDNLFSLQIMTIAKKTMCLSDKFYVRRVREESIMTYVKEFRSSLGYYTVINEYLQFIKEIAISEDFRHMLISRLRGIYGNSIDKLVNIDDKDLLEFTNDWDIKEQLEYMLYVKHFSNYKYSARKRQLELKAEVAELKKELSEIKNSKSYRFGYMIIGSLNKIKRVIFRK